MILAALQLAHLLLAHGGNGDWDDYALLVLAPVVIGGILWVTRRRGDDAEDTADESPFADEASDEPQAAESNPAPHR